MSGDAGPGLQVQVTPFAPEPGVLYLVATPIGNLQDMGLRALAVLHAVDRILCEDTRQTRKLLSHYGLRGRLVSFHAHNEARKIPWALERLQQGEALALVSDAGLPGIQDPGERLVRRAWEEGYRVTVIPGPNAIVTALVLSGLATVPFTFWGYMPRTRRAREDRVRTWMKYGGTHIVFETATRLQATLQVLAQLLPHKPVCLVKELTKIHEQRLYDTADRLQALFERQPDLKRGEWILLCHLTEPRAAVELDPDALKTVYRHLQETGLSARRALRLLARLTGHRVNQLYELLHPPDPPPQP